MRTSRRSVARSMSVAVADGAGEHVGRPTGDRRQRGGGADEPVRGFVERAVARGHDHDVDAVGRRVARQFACVVAAGRGDDLERVPGARAWPRISVESALRHRRRDRVHDEPQPHAGRLSSARYAPGPDGPRRSWRSSRRRSSSAARARGSWRGVSRSRARSGPSFRDEEYWGRPVPGFGDPAPGCCCSASPRPRTAATAPAASSPATVRATGCSRALHRAGFANQPTLGARRRRARAPRRVRRRRGAVRAARQQAARRRSATAASRSSSARSTCSRSSR